MTINFRYYVLQSFIENYDGYTRALVWASDLKGVAGKC